MGVVERPVAAAQTRRAGNRALHVDAGPIDRALDVEPLGEPGRDRRGERAAGAMGVAAGNTRLIRTRVLATRTTISLALTRTPTDMMTLDNLHAELSRAPSMPI